MPTVQHLASTLERHRNQILEAISEFCETRSHAARGFAQPLRVTAPKRHLEIKCLLTKVTLVVLANLRFPVEKICSMPWPQWQSTPKPSPKIIVPDDQF